jgi:RNA polymerase sigma factor (sigma-70 family)
MTDDAELLTRYAETHSEELFAELATRYLGLVYHSALRRLNQNIALAEEVTQAVFVSLAREAAHLSANPRKDHTLAGWLYGVTRHAAANALRAEARRARRESNAFSMHASDQNGNDGGNAWAELRPELEAVMDELGRADREAILLRYFENHSFADVGAALAISEDAARVRVNRALEKMRRLLARRKITSTAAALGGLIATQAVQAAPAGLMTSVTTSAFSAAAHATVINAGIWIFMTKTKLLVGAAGVMLAVTAGTVFYSSKNARALQADTDRLRVENARLSQRIAALESHAKPSSDARAEVFSSEQTAARDVSPPPPAPPTARPGITIKAPAGWSKNGAKAESYTVGVDSIETWGGMPSAYVESLTPAVDGGFGGMMQSTSAENYAGKRIRLSGWIKTKDANEGGGHLWLRVDGQERGRSLTLDNMNNRPVKGTTDWQEASIVLDVPADATALAYGFFVQGGGKMWVNGQQIEEVGADVPVTAEPRGKTPPKALPKTPSNLGFDPK